MFDNDMQAITLQAIGSRWTLYIPALTLVAWEIARGIVIRCRKTATAQDEQRPGPDPGPMLLWGVGSAIGYVVAYETIGGSLLERQAIACVTSAAWLLAILVGQATAYLIRCGLSPPRVTLLWVLPLLILMLDGALVTIT
ncbi:MAG: hypothetical protein ACYSTL_05250, partial [Planctomycetota bacterium]